MAVVALLVVAGLAVATGQGFSGTPAVAIESGSMMHCVNDNGRWTSTNYGKDCQRADDVPYGRFGTLDPGDVVFVRDVDKRGDVSSWADAVGSCPAGSFEPGSGYDGAYLDCGCDGVERYGACGDVIIFNNNGDTDVTPIIHRALFWLEVHGGGRFSIDLPESIGCADILEGTREDLARHTCLARLEASPLGQYTEMDTWGPERSGFITKGDNNNEIDQQDSHLNAVPSLPVQVAWIDGRAAGEVAGAASWSMALQGADAPDDVARLPWMAAVMLVAVPAIVLVGLGWLPPGQAGYRRPAWAAALSWIVVGAGMLLAGRPVSFARRLGAWFGLWLLGGILLGLNVYVSLFFRVAALALVASTAFMSWQAIGASTRPGQAAPDVPAS